MKLGPFLKQDFLGILEFKGGYGKFPKLFYIYQSFFGMPKSFPIENVRIVTKEGGPTLGKYSQIVR